MLESGCIQFTQPSAFNDPFENLPRITAFLLPAEIAGFLNEVIEERRSAGAVRRVLEEEFQRVVGALAASGQAIPPEVNHLMQDGHIRKVLEEWVLERVGPLSAHVLRLESAELRSKANELLSNVCDRFGVLCLTSLCDDLLMWSHYTQGHTGFVIGFDEKHPFFDQRTRPDDAIRHVRPVTYSRKRIHWRGFSVSPDAAQLEPFVHLLFLTKADAWAYEQEWRMVVPLPEVPAERVGQYRHQLEFPAGAVREIIVGSRATTTLRDALTSMVGSERYRHVNLRFARLHEEEYRVVVEDAVLDSDQGPGGASGSG